MKESLGSFWDEWEKETELEEKKLKEMQDKIHKQYLENMQEEKQMKQEQIRKMQKRYNFSIEDERIQIALERLESLAVDRFRNYDYSAQKSFDDVWWSVLHEVYCLLVLRKIRDIRLEKEDFYRQPSMSLRLLKLGTPLAIQNVIISVGGLTVQYVINGFGFLFVAGFTATNKLYGILEMAAVSYGYAITTYVGQNLGAKKIGRIKKGYHAALVLDVCFAVLAFIVIETLHTQISSLFLGKDGTALAYQVSEGYMRWLGYFFIFMGIKMATDGVLRGLGIMRPFLIANMVNLAIRLSVALICAPRFGIAFVWLAVPAGWLANFLISYAALRRSPFLL